VNRLAACLFLWGAAAWAGSPSATITIDYPLPGSVFPPDFAPPTFLWRDASREAAAWRIEIPLPGRTPPLRIDAAGEPFQFGPIDPRAVSDTNRPPQLTPELAATRTWRPDPATWEMIKKHSARRPVTVTITGYADSGRRRLVSRGAVTIQTSTDPVGAPIFYRDVPLMPSETEKGVIKPLARAGIPLIAWRLRNVSEPESRLLMTGLHTCANCHSFSRDGRTLGMDLDGPRNDKGMYAIASIAPHMAIRNEDVVAWTTFLGKPKGDLRVGFMSQVSPDGRYVVTMISGWERSTDGPETAPRRRSRRQLISNFYVANFKDYGFLQVFYPTRGILAVYDRASGRLQPLPGADDPRYVHTNAVWSPDGGYLVFARAEAREPYPDGRKMAEYAGDPNETPIQYDLYRIPFNQGRGGRPEPIAGASRNGMSNSFPKVSPDGKWIVFVKCRNGQLMRPDSELWIVPAAGGAARRMRANTARMNSWHSFSPNGRWLVFSSKARSPYTQMYLTHIDDAGNDSPPILIENATAANRAVNIPEFVNIPPDGLVKIDVPAVEFYRVFDLAWEAAEKGRSEEAIAGWRRALELSPNDARVHMNLGVSLTRAGQPQEAMTHYQKAVELDPDYPEAHLNLGVALAAAGRVEEAIAHYQTALELDPEYLEVYSNLGAAQAAAGRLDLAIACYRKALELDPNRAEVLSNLGVALARTGRLGEAIAQFEKAFEVNPYSGEIHQNLARALARAGRLEEAITRFEHALEQHPDSAELHNSLGVAFVWARRPDPAIAQFRKALELRPAFVEARYNLGDTLYYMKGEAAEALAEWRRVLAAAPDHVAVLEQIARLLATSPEPSLRNGAEAVALAERAAELTGGRQPQILDTLAAAYAEAGRFAEALETARRALALAEASGNAALAGTLQTRLALYASGKPLREAGRPLAPR
jgi:tetratricopeptide (TPR) repeat protein